MLATAPRPLTLTEISAAIPGARGAKNISPATLTRWILQGCTARTGQRIRLAATRAGQRWLVQEQDLTAFFAALGADPEATPAPVTRTESARRKASDAAGRKLELAGA